MILQYLLVAAGQATLPPVGGYAKEGTWPVYSTGEPTEPDGCLTVYNTSPTSDGRSMPDGAADQHYGLTIRVRAQDPVDAYYKAQQLLVYLSQVLYANELTIGSSTYIVQCASKIAIIEFGKNVPQSKRSLVNINFMVWIDPLS